MASSDNDTTAENMDTAIDAKTRFTSAVEDAKANARAQGEELAGQAKVKAEEAKVKAGELAVEAKAKAGELAVDGKAKASEALSGLSKIVDENTSLIDEKLGPKYGEYARKASSKMMAGAQTLDEKSVEELGEDAREAVRQNPGAAVGIAVIVGFLISRLFKR